MGSPLIGHQSRKLSRRAVLALFMLICLSLLARPVGAQVPTGDLGDAPDSTNHAGVMMPAYPAVNARYPVVFDPAAGAVQGPYHQNPKANGWLGADVSVEADADLLPDADGWRNINPVTPSPNRDRFDDGLFPTLLLPQCQQTQLTYRLTGAAAVPAPQGFVNVWIDFNRDGDWADRFNCTTSTGAVRVVREWAVMNQPVNIATGTFTWTTPPFISRHGQGAIWMRISVANAPAPLNPNLGRADGRGPAAGYLFGETEDYILKPLGNNRYEACGNNVTED